MGDAIRFPIFRMIYLVYEFSQALGFRRLLFVCWLLEIGKAGGCVMDRVFLGFWDRLGIGSREKKVLDAVDPVATMKVIVA